MNSAGRLFLVLIVIWAVCSLVACGTVYPATLRVVECQARIPLAGVDVYIREIPVASSVLRSGSAENTLFVGQTDSDGVFKFKMIDGVPYYIMLEYDGYEYDGQSGWVYEDLESSGGSLTLCMIEGRRE